MGTFEDPPFILDEALTSPTITRNIFMANRSEQETIKLIRQVLGEHKDLWMNRLGDMKRLRRAYMTRFFEDLVPDESSLRVETSDGYTFVEAYIASLFEKSPSIEADSMQASADDIEIAKACINSWMSDNRKALENGSRLALIYPMAFFKISPRDSMDPLNRVAIRALEPWNVILDRDADLWDEQRFVAHHYYLPLNDATALYGSKKWNPVSKPDYFQNEDRVGSGKFQSLPNEYKYIEVVEFYDLTMDKMYIFSPNYKVGGGLLEDMKIPLRNYDGSPLVPIAPLYYSRTPDKPMDGYSTLGRVYDQLFEKNIIRTFWANAIRRDSRQFLYKEGVIDEESLAKISAGQDGAMIPVDADSLDGLIRSIPVEPLSANFDRYLGMVESDIQRGSIISANTKGEATKATATEVTALAQYTASEIGRMARERDEAIEMLANIFIRMLVYQLEDNERPVIMIGKKPQFVTSDKLDHKIKYYALDQASTPLSKELKKRQLVDLLPVLAQLNVDPKAIKEELIRSFNLPETFLKEPEKPKLTESPEVAAPMEMPQ